MKKYDVKIEFIKDMYLQVFADNKIDAEARVCNMINNSCFEDYISSKIHSRYNFIVKKQRREKNK